MIRIRQAGAADAGAIGTLHAASWRSAYRGILADSYLDGPVLADRREAWMRRFTPEPGPDLVVTLAEEPAVDEPVGFACILAGQDRRWGSLIDNLHVRPGRTGGRIGPRLLGEAARLLSPSHAATPLHLTVFEQNGRAIAAYESWGGRLAERLDHVEPDGRPHRIRRYVWDSPAALLACLDGPSRQEPSWRT